METKRALVQQLAAEYATALLCATLELPRSTYYYAAQARADETTLQARLKTLADVWVSAPHGAVAPRLSADGE